MQAAWGCLPQPSHVNKQHSGTFPHSLTENRLLRLDFRSCIHEAALALAEIFNLFVFLCRKCGGALSVFAVTNAFYFGDFPSNRPAAVQLHTRLKTKLKENNKKKNIMTAWLKLRLLHVDAIKTTCKHHLTPSWIPLNKKSCNFQLLSLYMTVPQWLKPRGQRWCEYSTRFLDTQKLLSQAQSVLRTVLGSKTCRDASRGQRALWLLSSCRSFSLHQCLHTLPLYLFPLLILFSTFGLITPSIINLHKKFKLKCNL